MDLHYIGTHYQGWQSQPSGLTIQDQLETILAKVLQENVRVTGSSRTDAGVHARQQVACFRSTTNLSASRIHHALNRLLPSDIGIDALEICADDFHPIRDSVAKFYVYRLWRSRFRQAFKDPFVWTIHDDLDLKEMLRAARVLIGTHDFTSFSSVDSSAKTKVREIIDIRFQESGSQLEILFLGRGFLKQMIRNCVGALVEVGRAKKSVEMVAEILAVKDRTKAGIAAPAQGLCLEKIYFSEPPKEYFAESLALC